MGRAFRPPISRYGINGVSYVQPPHGSGPRHHCLRFGERIKIRHIPFRGNAPGIQAVVANVVSCTSQTEVKSFVDEGQLRAFATTGKRRDPRFPDLPTVAEAGVAGYETSWWHAVYVPAGTSSAIVEKLTGALQAVMQDSEGRAQLEEIGLVAQYRPAEQVTQQTSSDMASFRKIAKESNISLD